MTREQIIEELKDLIKKADIAAEKATNQADTLFTGYYEGKAAAYAYALFLLNHMEDPYDE